MFLPFNFCFFPCDTLTLHVYIFKERAAMQNKSPLSTLIQRQAAQYTDRTALQYRDYQTSKWRSVSWREFAQYVRLVSSALVQLGVEVQEKVAVFSQNMPECLYVDFGAYGIRAVTIPFYATSSEAQVKYMVTDADIRFIFVGGQEEYEVAFRVLQLTPIVKRLIIFSREVVRKPQDQTSLYFDQFLEIGERVNNDTIIAQRTSELDSEDLANVLYTSGTTGLSKGVMLTHGMYQAAISAHEHVLPLTERDVVLSFLPFTHVFERGWSYLCLATGCTLAINMRPNDILQSLKEVHPTCMCTVPRFWEKVYAAVQDVFAKSNPMQYRLLKDVLACGHEHNVCYMMQGKTPPLWLRLKWKMYQATVLPVFLKTMGLERHHFFPTAGAAIPPVVEEFVHSVGIRMVAGYGMTESTATVSCDRIGMPVSIGSVGRLLPGVEISFGLHNEILLKGPTIMQGYFRKTEVTALSFDQDGWFHTGDAGYMRDGELFLTDRIKDMFKTSNGKYIAPQLLESKLSVDRYIDQIVIIANERKFVSALVVPNYDLLEEYAKRHNMAYTSHGDLCACPQIVQLVMERIETLQQEFAHYERVKRITLLPQALTLEKGELTNTLKVCRSVLSERYKNLIDKMYEE